MPRANRCFLPGHVWHITHRCHQKDFLLKFAKDRKCWRYWLFEAKKRYGLCVLNFIVTSNHIHLLVRDTGKQVISKSMQLIAGRVAQEYNQRKKRSGAYWEDRYHATAIETDKHLIECMIYIDLNMVRAGVVNHPAEWLDCGYKEIQQPSERYNIIDTMVWMELLGIDEFSKFQQRHISWINSKLESGQIKKDSRWSERLAVGSSSFIARFKTELERDSRIRTPEIRSDVNPSSIKEDLASYNANFHTQKCSLSMDNRRYWK